METPAPAVLALATQVATATDRGAAARVLAEALGAQTCILFIRDRDVAQLLPAPGFPQTLPGGAEWRRFLTTCVEDGQHTAALPYPTAQERYHAYGLAGGADIVCVLLGSEDMARVPQSVRDALRQALPLLGAALAGERAVATAEAQARLAHEVAEQSRALAHVLDDARQALQRALADAEEQHVRVLAQSAQLDTMLQALPDALVVYAPDGAVARANAPARTLFAQITGSAPARVADCDLARVLTPALLGRLAPGGTPEPMDSTALRADETVVAQALRGHAAVVHVTLPRDISATPEVHLMLRAAPILFDTGQPTGAVLVVSDVSILYALDQHKEEFLSVVSHELRTPLTTLNMVSHLLRHHPHEGDPAWHGATEHMDRAIHRLDRLVGDLVQTSRIQGGQLEVHIDACNLSQVCQQVVEEQRMLMGHPIMLEAAQALVMVPGDAERIGQVLTNLLSNAVKYSPASVPVLVHLTSDGRVARVSVQDAGTGIAPEVQGRIFERFFRVRGARIMQGSGVGLGLGLFIAKSIIEQHGGTIGVESAPGVGSTFWFALPCAVPSTAAPQAPHTTA